MKTRALPTPFYSSRFISLQIRVFRKAVEHGLFPSGFAHWKTHGESEEIAGLREPHINFKLGWLFPFCAYGQEFAHFGTFESPFAHYVSIRHNQVVMREVASAFLFDEGEYSARTVMYLPRSFPGSLFAGLITGYSRGGMKNG